MLRFKKRWLLIPGVLLLLGAVVYVALPFYMRTGAKEPPLNTVVINAWLSTSGQPSDTQLQRLRAQGYEAVVNLAPPESYGSIATEADIVQQQGMAYYNIPVRWEQPTASDFKKFQGILQTLHGRKIWVHCQMNMRASVFVLLHRVIDQHEPLTQSMPSVHAVWVPNDIWTDFIRNTLTQHSVKFDPDELR